MSELADDYREMRDRRQKRRRKMVECWACGHDGYKVMPGEKCPRCGTEN